MIEIRPNVLYTRDDLAVMLKPAGVDVDHFIARVKPRKFLRMVWLGEDILAAMRAAPALAERGEDGGGPAVVEIPAPVLAVGAGRRGRRAASPAARPGSKLQAHLKSLKD